jgi:hypothetical protein
VILPDQAGTEVRAVSMPRAIDVSGQKFSRLTAVRCDGSVNGRRIWLCSCDCGAMVRVALTSLRSGNTKSCGCYSAEVRRTCARQHGDSDSPEHCTWMGMRQRCYKPTSPDFADYGGRGIRVCDEWNADYSAFLRDMGRRPSSKHSIDRIDVNGNYEPGNCRWATNTEQARNRRNNHVLEHDGVRMTLTEWAEKIGIHQVTLRQRIERLGLEEALTTPKLRFRRSGIKNRARCA